MLEKRIESRQGHRSDVGEAHCNSILAVYPGKPGLSDC
jgi:hypothetical protein